MKILLSIISIFIITACASGEKKISTNDSSSAAVEASGQDVPAKIESIEVEGAQIEVMAPTNRYENDVMQAFENKDQRRLENLISNKLAEDENHLFSLNVLGAFHFEQGSTRLARMIWDRANSVNNRSAMIQNNLGATYHFNDPERAIQFYKRALQIDSRNPFANYNIGSIYVKYKNFSMAETTLSNAYRSIKTYEVANNYALALKGNGKVNDSIKVYESLIRTNSNNYHALLNYAGLLIDVNRDLDKARDAINRAKLITQDRNILRYIGELERRLGN